MGRRCVHWGGLAALGTVVAWTPVSAQTAYGLADARHLTISPQVVTTYASNVAGANAASAAARGLTQGDVYVQPSVTIDALSPVGRETVFLSGSVGYDFYEHDTVLNRERINLNGGVSADLSRCQPKITGSYARYQSQLEELLPGPGAASVSPQNAATSVGVGFLMSCPRAEGFSPTIAVSHSVYRNSNERFRITDNNSTSATAGLSYARPALGAIEMFGSFSSVAYDNPFLIPFPPFLLKNNYDLYSGGLRYDRPIGTRLIGAVSVSYATLVPETAIRAGFSSLTYSGDLSYQVTWRLNLHARVGRATQPTNQVGASYYIDNPRQIDANYRLGTRLTLTLGGSDESRSYQGGEVGQIAGVVSNQRIDRLFGSAKFTLNRRLNVVLDASNEHRASNLGLFDYTGNRISLTLNGVF